MITKKIIKFSKGLQIAMQIDMPNKVVVQHHPKTWKSVNTAQIKILLEKSVRRLLSMDNNTSVCKEHTLTMGEMIYIYAWYGTRD